MQRFVVVSRLPLPLSPFMFVILSFVSSFDSDCKASVHRACVPKAPNSCKVGKRKVARSDSVNSLESPDTPRKTGLTLNSSANNLMRTTSQSDVRRGSFAEPKSPRKVSFGGEDDASRNPLVFLENILMEASRLRVKLEVSPVSSFSFSLQRTYTLSDGSTGFYLRGVLRCKQK